MAANHRAPWFSYPCQNAILRFMKFEVRYRLVQKTQSKYVSVSNNSVAFQFDSLQISIQKIVFHDHWYWHLSRGKVEIQGFPKRKTVRYNISDRASESRAMGTVFRFFLDRQGTVIRKLNVMSTEALEYIPPVYVRDEVIIWNHDYIPMEYYQKIRPFKRLKKVTVYNDSGDLALFKLPMIATAREWHVHFDLPIKVFLDSMVPVCTWESHGIPYDTISLIYENWKVTNRPEHTTFQLKTANKILLLEMAAHIPDAIVYTHGADICLNSLVMLELNEQHNIEVFIGKKAGLIMIVTKKIQEKDRCCTIL